MSTVGLKNFSDELSALVARGEKHLVRVEARRRISATGVVWAKGVLVTAHHAVERDEGLRIGLPDGREVEATLAGRDPSTDLAVLKASFDLVPPDWAEGDALKIGQLVLAVGRPGARAAATVGILSALDTDWRTRGGGRIDRYVESDVDLPPGFSGSLLFDSAGRAIGLNTSGLIRGRSIAIPAATIRRVVKSLLERGGVRRGFLGVGSIPVRLPSSLYAQVGQDSAVILISVQPGGPADAAGLLLGDILLSLDGHPVTDVGGLIELLDEERIGRESTVRLVRAGEVKDVRVTIGSRSAS